MSYADSYAGIDIEGLVSQIDIDELGLDDINLSFDFTDDGSYPDFLYEKTTNRQSKLADSLARVNKRSGISAGSISEFGFYFNGEEAK